MTDSKNPPNGGFFIAIYMQKVHVNEETMSV